MKILMIIYIVESNFAIPIVVVNCKRIRLIKILIRYLWKVVDFPGMFVVFWLLDYGKVLPLPTITFLYKNVHSKGTTITNQQPIGGIIEIFKWNQLLKPPLCFHGMKASKFPICIESSNLT